MILVIGYLTFQLTYWKCLRNLIVRKPACYCDINWEGLQPLPEQTMKKVRRESLVLTFKNKVRIALKEMRESNYWLRLLKMMNWTK